MWVSNVRFESSLTPRFVIEVDRAMLWPKIDILLREEDWVW